MQIFTNKITQCKRTGDVMIYTCLLIVLYCIIHSNKRSLKTGEVEVFYLPLHRRMSHLGFFMVTKKLLTQRLFVCVSLQLWSRTLLKVCTPPSLFYLPLHNMSQCKSRHVCVCQCWKDIISCITLHIVVTEFNLLL